MLVTPADVMMVLFLALSFLSGGTMMLYSRTVQRENKEIRYIPQTSLALKYMLKLLVNNIDACSHFLSSKYWELSRQNYKQHTVHVYYGKKQLTRG